MESTEAVNLYQTLVPLIGLILIIGSGVILLVHQFQKSLFRQQVAQEEMKLHHQRELLRTTIDAQEKERKRIAHDLHDELGARLSMTLMQLKQADDPKSASREQLKTLLPQLQNHVEIALNTSKDIGNSVMPLHLTNLPLNKSLLNLIREMQNAGGFEVQLTSPDELDLLIWPAKVSIYRMLSELLNNTLKHANASRVSILIAVTTELVNCVYQDNGHGFKAPPSQKGLGLQSLEGRASSLNGSFEYSQNSDQGFQAIISFPIPSA